MVWMDSYQSMNATRDVFLCDYLSPCLCWMIVVGGELLIERARRENWGRYGSVDSSLVLVLMQERGRRCGC
jgi:hypothetical protein